METATNNGMCRCCASEGTFKDVKSTYHWMGEEEVYSDMLKVCFDITLCTAEDGDNGGICEVCITQLRNAANFKKQVLHTEEQFKKRLHDKMFKTSIVKVEIPRDDRMESDNNLSEDYSGPEFEVPIKEESLEETKPKKRAAKATSSRSKKSKLEVGETSTKRGRNSKIVKEEPRAIAVAVKSLKSKKSTTESVKMKHNLKNIFLYSNANPIKTKDSQGYGCSFCPKKFQNPTNLKEHFLIEHSDNKMIDYLSSRFFDRVVKLDITYLNCALCDKDIKKLEEFTEHLMQAHGKTIHMDVMNQILPFKFETKELLCAICSTEYTSFKLLQVHMNLHFRNHICDVCGAGFVNERLLNTHKTRHATGEFKCEQCDKTYINEKKRLEHLRRTHLGQSKRNRCKYCDEKFNDYWKKIEHMVNEHGFSRPIFKCQACERTFINQRHLAYHTRKDHLMEKKYKCSECDMKFFKKNYLENHMVKHTGSRSFVCDVCSKAYGRKSTLREHMRIHKNDRRFKCVECGQAFVQKCSWRSHMRSKHNVII